MMLKSFLYFISLRYNIFGDRLVVLFSMGVSLTS